MHCDVLIVGAGPAGAAAALVLARAGLRVRLVDRARFPRPKLCGDSLNPGALAILRRLDVAGTIGHHGLPVHGMLVTGEHVAVDAPYPAGVSGLSIRRDLLDAALVDAAVAAGAEFADGVTVSDPLTGDGPRGTRVVGARCRLPGGAAADLRAPVTIAADGRTSTLAFALGLVAHPARPRRWAVGAYMSGVASTSGRGEMHIRQGHYIGVAPVAGGAVNVCVVRPSRGGDPLWRDPEALLRDVLLADPLMRDRCERPSCVERPVVLGPLAVDAVPDRVAPAGLLVAGDASGFVDPMTGDGMRFALRGGELAAYAAMSALAHGWRGVQSRLARDRHREFGAKWRVNRLLRGLVAAPAGVRGAALGARLAPSILRALVTYASDCRLARVA
jgi:menaquinone-9 beta-reductase